MIIVTSLDAVEAVDVLHSVKTKIVYVLLKLEMYILQDCSNVVSF